jgi:hypothetical protein
MNSLLFSTLSDARSATTELQQHARNFPLLTIKKAAYTEIIMSRGDDHETSIVLLAAGH